MKYENIIVVKYILLFFARVFSIVHEMQLNSSMSSKRQCVEVCVHQANDTISPLHTSISPLHT